MSQSAEGRPAAQWKKFTTAKQRELDAEMKRLVITKHVLTRMNACLCVTLEEGGRAFLEAIATYPSEPPISLKTQRRRAAKRLKSRT